MASPSPAPPAITVIGDGLAGSLLALSLAHRGAAVRLIGAASETATFFSYGSLPRGRASRPWLRLQRRHGPMGWQPSGLVLHEQRPGLLRRLAALTRQLPLPLARVDPPTWMAARPQVLAAAGVRQVSGRVRGLRPRRQGGWLLDLEQERGDQPLAAETVVLAAGAWSRALWPALPARFHHSWAGVLLLHRIPASHPWLDLVRRGRIVQPLHRRRQALEASAPHLERADWIVDAGLAPWGEGAVLGQITWLSPPGAPDPAASSPEPPSALWMEERLRDGLGQVDPELAALQAPYHQVPVSFCTDGRPLAGPVADAPGLWVFAGFSDAFSRVPSLAEALATRLLAP